MERSASVTLDPLEKAEILRQAPQEPLTLDLKKRLSSRPERSEVERSASVTLDPLEMTEILRRAQDDRIVGKDGS